MNFIDFKLNFMKNYKIKNQFIDFLKSIDNQLIIVRDFVNFFAFFFVVFIFFKVFSNLKNFVKSPSYQGI